MAFIIGIAGGTGSGKTTLTKRIADELGKNAVVICHDNYYKATDGISDDERKKINYDSPNAFDNELMIKHLEILKNGKAICCPVYDYEKHNRSNQTVLIKHANIIIVEGILVLHNEELRKLMDLKIFVDTDADERLMRRISRDTKERGRTVSDIIEQYRTTVKPMHEKFVEPSKKYADIIVCGNAEDTKAYEMICKQIVKLAVNC